MHNELNVALYQGEPVLAALILVLIFYTKQEAEVNNLSAGTKKVRYF